MVLFLMIAFILLPEAKAITELSGNFGYNKFLFGVARKNSITTRSYSASLAFYFFSSLAIEVNYQNAANIRIENDTYKIEGISNEYSVVQSRREVIYDSYGIGLKFSFAPRGYPVRPMMSLGYAKKFAENQGYTVFEKDSDQTQIKIDHNSHKSREDSVFASFQLKLRITNRLSLTGSVKTVFKAFEWNEAKNSLKYLVGFSWII